MFTKRETILGGLLTIVTGPRFSHSHAQTSDIHGCMLPGSVARSYLGNLSEQLRLPERLISRSGNLETASMAFRTKLTTSC